MSRHIKSAHTITQDDDNFMLVLSKKSEIKCKICNVIFPKTYSLKRHMDNKHEGYDSNKPNRLVFGKNVFVVSQEENILPNIEMIVNFAHEIVEDVLKTIFKPIETFACHTCEKYFPKKYMLNKHLSIIHINSEIK